LRNEKDKKAGSQLPVAGFEFRVQGGRSVSGRYVGTKSGQELSRRE
jgi:hypothetical protein